MIPPVIAQILIKIVGGALIIAAAVIGWKAATSYYVDIGEANVQAKWDKQKAIDTLAYDNKVRDMQNKYIVQLVSLNSLIDVLTKGKQDADDERDQAITALHANTLRLRRFDCVPTPAANSETTTSANTSSAATNYSCGIPLEIGEAAIRAKHEFVTLKDKFDLCVGILQDERK